MRQAISHLLLITKKEVGYTKTFKRQGYWHKLVLSHIPATITLSIVT